MRLLLVLLLTGCAHYPQEKTLWIPRGGEPPAGTIPVTLNRCCGSMRPAIQGGEIAYAIPYDGRPLVGHIVSNKTRTHRVTAENENEIYTSGDANEHSDGWSPKSEIVWIILYIERP